MYLNCVCAKQKVIVMDLLTKTQAKQFQLLCELFLLLKRRQTVTKRDSSRMFKLMPCSYALTQQQQHLCMCLCVCVLTPEKGVPLLDR